MSCEYCEEAKYQAHWRCDDGYTIPLNFCPNCGTPLTEPKPLTVEELRGMGDVPIWVSPERDDDMWCVWEGSRAEIPGCDHWWWDLDDYGKTWIAYDRKPTDERSNSK